MKKKYSMAALSIITICCLLLGCKNKNQLKPVTVEDFSKFVSATGYQTDAEIHGWSFVQQTVFKSEIVDGATWKLPNAIDTAGINFPVTQVSYNDAMAYCKWANAELPSYSEYWDNVNMDNRKVIKNSDEIHDVLDINIVGNTWDITRTKNFKGEIRLAGGSYLCDIKTCDGTTPDRKLYVSKNTGNSNISFSVIKH